MRICYYLTDRHGPGNLRSLLPGAELARQYGWDVTSMQTLTFVKGHLDVDADIYVMQRQTHPALPAVVRDMVELQGKCVIGEVDDWFLGLSTMQNIGSNASHRYYSVMPKILAACTGVTVSTEVLRAGYAERTRRPVQVVENTLDWNMWKDVVVPPAHQLRIGWMGGSGWHLKDLAVIGGVIGEYCRAHPEVQFVAAGDGKVHELLGIPEAQRVTYPTVPFDQLAEITATFDIGLVPLAKSKFNDAKSYLKGLEYAACGIPCIASPSAEYRKWVRHGENGFLAERHRDWTRYLDILRTNPTLREQMGRAAREQAAQHTIQDKVHDWYKFYMQCYESTQEANQHRALNDSFTLVDVEALDHGWYDDAEPEAVK